MGLLSVARGRRVRLLAGMVIALLAVGASRARAASTASITTPNDRTLLYANLVSHPHQTFRVSGTSTGLSGQSLDIDCYQNTGEGEIANAFYTGPGGQGIPVNSNGSFSAHVPATAFDSNHSAFSCQLLAVPHNTQPSPSSGYSGPRVGFSYLATTPASAGPASGKPEDFTFADDTLTTGAEIRSVNGCGPSAYPLDGTPSMFAGLQLFNCAGSFLDSPSAFTATPGPDLTRSEIELDGQPAYGSFGAAQLFSGSDQLSGFRPLSVSASFNTTTGVGQVTDIERLVKCSGANPYGPTSASQCPSFVLAGVTLKRVTTFIHHARIQSVTDTLSSTDAKKHTADLLYEDDLGTAQAGWALPGEASFQAHSTGDTAGPPSAPEGSVYGIDATSEAASLDNPVGALTFLRPYRSVRFDNTLWLSRQSALFDYKRTVPAGGSASITWGYSTDISLPQVRRDADLVAPPEITISSPKRGATVSKAQVVVRGRAAAGSGVRRVKVNGIAAAVSGDAFSATIPLKKGSNTITASLTSQAGDAAHASITVMRG